MDFSEQLFSQIKEGLLNIDPVTWIENNLNLDGKPFRINGNGYKPFADIYRYIGVKALERDSKPIIIVKGRQVGATTMAAALECFFMASGSFGTLNRRPIRVAHCFPLLDLAASYSRAKLAPMISGAKSIEKNNKNGKNKSVVESKIDKSSASNDNQFFKQFIGGNQLWIESTGINGDRLMGKQLALDTELPTPNGFVKLNDLKEGDKLFDEKGNVCTIIKLYPIQISPESYRITFDDGTVVDACADHLWLTYTKRDRINLTKFRNGKSKNKPIPKIKNTKEIFLSLKKSGENNHSIPNCLPVNYIEKELPIDPYLFGLWLGNGNQYGEIKTTDPTILKNYNVHVIPSSVKKSKCCSYCIDGLTSKLIALKLIKNTNNKVDNFYNKHIPEIYMYSSFEQRLALLQGLLDSRGHCEKNGMIKFTQVIKNLSYQIYELVLSLGIKANFSKNKSVFNDKQHKDRYCIKFTTQLPVFRLEKKLKNIKKNDKNITKNTHRFITKIEQIESIPMRCLKVDSPSHLFLITRKFLPTHNTCDVFFADEAQKMRKSAIANSTKILSQAQYGRRTKGVQVYFGTPLQSGSHYWENWNNSSQQYYHLGCKRCNDYFPLFTGNDDWEKIWLYEYIVRCTKCGYEQDKLEAAERGKWVALNKNPNAEYIGFHINQLYNPMYRKEDIIKEQPANSPVNTERAYRNEVLGMFYSGSSAPITPEEIDEKCADHGRKFTKSISISETRRSYAGFDWGDLIDIEPGIGGNEGESSKRGGQSYSCGIILTAETPHILSIEFATLLKRNDPEYKREVVEQIFRQFNVKLGVGDIGYANDLTYNLQKEHGDKFLASRACSSVKNHIKLENSIFPKEIQFEKDYLIKELYDMMKQGRIRFPYGNYEQIGWLINHCCSMELKPTTDRSGELKLRYVKGNSPNDGFMALLNAYLAYKFDISQGFTIYDPNRMQADPKEKKGILAVLGYMPNRRHS